MRAVATIREHADELTALDQAIGDGDHGINMRRGFDAIAADARRSSPPCRSSEALQKAGMTLVMKVGGASGPLYGSLLMAMGKAGHGRASRLAGDVRAGHRGGEAARQLGRRRQDHAGRAGADAARAAGAAADGVRPAS